MAKHDHIGTRVTRLRTLRGLTMEELARQAGVTRQAISRIEQTGGISVPVLAALAAALHVPVAELLS